MWAPEVGYKTAPGGGCQSPKYGADTDGGAAVSVDGDVDANADGDAYGSPGNMPGCSRCEKPTTLPLESTCWRNAKARHVVSGEVCTLWAANLQAKVQLAVDGWCYDVPERRGRDRADLPL